MYENNMPTRFNPQQVPKRGPYIEITCSVRSDHTWTIPCLPGKQVYTCPNCFGFTYVKIEQGELLISGEATRKTIEIDNMRLMIAQASQFHQPTDAQSLEDLLNSFK